jgi:hypothetical protein
MKNNSKTQLPPKKTPNKNLQEALRKNLSRRKKTDNNPKNEQPK